MSGQTFVRDLAVWHPFNEEEFHRLDAIPMNFIGGIQTSLTSSLHTSELMRLWFQNTCDFHHLKNVHKEFGTYLIDEPYDIQIEVNNNLYRSSHKIKVRPDIRFKYEELIGEKLQDYFYHSLQVINLKEQAGDFFHLSRTSFLGVFYSHELQVPGQSKIHTRFFTPKKFKLSKHLRGLVLRKNQELLNEDKEIIEEWAKTYHLCSHKNWLPNEERIRAYLQFLHTFHS